MSWMNDNAISRTRPQAGLRGGRGAAEGGLSPLPPKTPRNGESGAVFRIDGRDVRWCRRAGCGDSCAPRMRPTFTTWPLAAVTVARGPKSLHDHALSARRPIARGGPATVVVKRCSMFDVRCSRFRVQGSGFRVQGSGFVVRGSGFNSQFSSLTPRLLLQHSGRKTRRLLQRARAPLEKGPSVAKVADFRGARGAKVTGGQGDKVRG